MLIIFCLLIKRTWHLNLPGMLKLIQQIVFFLNISSGIIFCGLDDQQCHHINNVITIRKQNKKTKSSH